MTRKRYVGFALVLIAGLAAAGHKRNRPKAMDLIISQANAETCDHDYSKASAKILVWERWNGTSLVIMRIRGVKPKQLHTVWLKLAKASPITGIPVTAAAPTTGLKKISDNAGTKSAAGANAFYTNSKGNAWVFIKLDFRLSDGVYPFSKHNSALADVDIGHTPFTFRVVSHCADNLQRGLTPGANEPTFDVSLQ